MIDDMMKLSVDAFFSDFNPSSEKNAKEYKFPVPGYQDEENMWEFMCNIKDKKSKKEGKYKYVTSKPLPMNSKYAFQVKDRSFKIKKYNVPVPV